MKNHTLPFALLGAAVWCACGPSATPPATPPPAPAPPGSAAMQPAPPTPPDPLGPRPLPAPPPPFVPAAPRVFAGPSGSKVWLFERRALPLVSVALVVPYGGALDPAGQDGLAFVTADMLDEGGGKRDALQFSAALETLGAQLGTSADRDTSSVSLQVLNEHIGDALVLFADAVMKPRHAAKDFQRVSSLWINALKARAQEPNEVARVVMATAFYGANNPYGRPVDGTVASAQKVKLPSIVAFHKQIWRPDAATFVVVGDIDEAKLSPLLEKAFAGWKTPATAAPAIVAPPPPPAPAGVRTFLVDRPDAPQIVVSVGRQGVTANDPELPRLEMLNIALGGSFTSRLNQDLREDHGWTYGARSRFNLQRGSGMFVARAAIRTDAISGAIGETWKVIDQLAKDGITDDELGKIRAQVQVDALEAYASLRGITGSLASNASLALGPDADAKALASQRSATLADLRTLASAHLDLDHATLVLVGPREPALTALQENKLPEPEMVDEEGHALRAQVKR